MEYLGAFPAKVRRVGDAAEETLLLSAFQDPVRAKQNAFVAQGSLQLKLDACGQLLHIMQAPSSVEMRGARSWLWSHWMCGGTLGCHCDYDGPGGSTQTAAEEC